MGTEPGGSVLESATFANALDALKQKGSNILLVGDGATAAHRSGCNRLLGETSDESRYRLFVVTEDTSCSCGEVYALAHHSDQERDSDSDSDQRGDGVPDGPTDATAGYDEFESDGTITRVITRSADDTERTSLTDPSVVESVVGTEMLSILGTEVIENINEFDDQADGLEPSELRICVDSLVPLFAAHSSENVFRFLHVMTLRVRQASGMGHYHLPIDPDHDAVNLLEPLFDAVVEVRADGDDAQQRWHLRDQRTPSEWIPL